MEVLGTNSHHWFVPPEQRACRTGLLLSVLESGTSRHRLVMRLMNVLMADAEIDAEAGRAGRTTVPAVASTAKAVAASLRAVIHQVLADREARGHAHWWDG
ncbi:hypothetical protein GCM10009634_39610 [Saccharothrix xinjiangensis]